MRIPATAPVPGGAVRPRWSVMIPAYNCAHLLRQTLESVLIQAPDESVMQIEVVDDCSTQDDPQRVVAETGRGRVSYHRKPVNSGPIHTFNTCVERSRGEFVHILHGDDWVLPGFYTKVEQGFASDANVALVTTRSLITDEAGTVVQTSPMVREMKTFTHDTSALHVTNPLRTPAVAIRRSFYERHGGFMPEFIHTADWEMWVRAIRIGGGVMIDEPLACYRDFSQNHTALLARTGRHFEDTLRLADYWIETGLPGFEARGLRNYFATLALYHSRLLRRQGDAENAARCQGLWATHATMGRRLSEAFKSAARAILRR